MPNKLLIKANFCDLRNVKEENLAAYDVIESAGQCGGAERPRKRS